MKNLKKLDGSFVIEVNGLPYHTIEFDKYYETTLKQYKKHPELFEIEKEYIKTLEELKQEKILELKEKRDEYKKTIFIKDKNLLDLENKSEYHFDNLILGLCGYTETDLEKCKTYISNISKIYDNYKLKINDATTKQELDKIIINFKLDK